MVSKASKIRKGRVQTKTKVKAKAEMKKSDQIVMPATPRRLASFAQGTVSINLWLDLHLAGQLCQ
jgi:hypothetical protein